MSVKDNINILRLEGVDTSKMDDLLKTLGIFEKKNAKTSFNFTFLSFTVQIAGTSLITLKASRSFNILKALRRLLESKLHHS
jgi:hypothetical protein